MDVDSLADTAAMHSVTVAYDNIKVLVRVQRQVQSRHPLWVDEIECGSRVDEELECDRADRAL